MRIVTREYFLCNCLSDSDRAMEASVEKKVRGIIEAVRKEGDKALLRFGASFDKVRLSARDLVVGPQEFDRAEKFVPKSFILSLKAMEKNIRRYQKDLLFTDWTKLYGKVRLGCLARPVERAGIYIPGGTAPLVSTVLMTVIPAKVAGVDEVIVATPPDRKGMINPYILFACKATGVSRVFRVGGAQAIAAMAFGTQTIPQVDKIVGPGNIFVATAKRQVYGYVGIDMVAGPSEVLLIADDTADPSYIAADLLAQAEHDILARTFLITTSKTLGRAVVNQIEIQMKRLGRASIARHSMKRSGFIILVKDLKDAVDLANKIAPEHLEILCADAQPLVARIRNAGAVFVGEFTPEPVGDYIAGPSHVLPTGGTARFFSPLSARDFIKTVSFLQYDRASLKKELDIIQQVANIEGLDAHRRSAEVRFT